MTAGSAEPPSDLDAWVLETAPRAVAYARSLLRDPHQAEDIVQDCYCRLLAKADVYDLPRDGLKLLLRAVSNACINTRTRRRPMFRFDADPDRPDDPPDPSVTSPTDRMLFEELSEAVAAALRELPEQQRAAIQLKSLGYSQAEVAEILGVSASNAGVLIHRGRQTMALKLTPYLGDEAVK